jgi:protein-tyrosine phosphatase
MVDIIGGFIVAILSFYFFQEGNQRHNTNHKVGTLYGTLTITVLIVSLLSWPLGIFLWWPATSLLILTCSYFGLVQTVYHKRNGKLTPWTRLPHAFPLLGQHLSLLYYKRQANPWDRIIPGLYIGRCLNEQEAHKLQKQGVTNTLDLTTEFSESGPLTTTGYLNIPVLDLTAPTAKQLAQGICFITEGRKNGTVYVHCKIGYSRTVAMVGAYLLASHKARNTEEALDQIRQARPGVVIRPEVLQALHQYETSAAHSRKPRDCQ